MPYLIYDKQSFHSKQIQVQLTALVRTALWGAVKKNGALRQRVACRLIEEKRSGLKQNTLLIEGITYGPSLCLFVKKVELTVRQKVGQIFIIVIRVIFARAYCFCIEFLKKSRVRAACSP